MTSQEKLPGKLRKISTQTTGEQRIAVEIGVIQKRALKCIFPGLGYAEILTRVNLHTFNVRRDGTALVKNILKKLKSAHVDKMFCCLKKDIPCIILLERIDNVTPLYRGLYTNVSKKAISTVLFAVSNAFLLYLYDILMSYL